jgi:Arc/MetJ family transcription regulator
MRLHQLTESKQNVAEAAEDRTSYQVAKILFDKGIKYDSSSKEGELINAIGLVMVKELNMDPRIVRNIISRDDDFLADTLDELYHMSQGVTENSQRVDSLVTDALRIMKGAEVGDAVSALKTVLGDREYNGRRGHYNFYVKQIIDMYSQQGAAGK